MRELSIFIDESGDAAFRSAFYLVALVFHEQSTSITNRAERHERHLETRTDVEFFGSIRNFKKNYLKKIRRKRLN